MPTARLPCCDNGRRKLERVTDSLTGGMMTLTDTVR